MRNTFDRPDDLQREQRSRGRKVVWVPVEIALGRRDDDCRACVQTDAQLGCAAAFVVATAVTICAGHSSVCTGCLSIAPSRLMLMNRILVYLGVLVGMAGRST